MSIRDDYDALLPEHPLEETSDSEMTATATDHTRTVSGTFGVSLEEAANRNDVVLDKELGVWRELQPGETMTKDTVRAFWLSDGIPTDMTLAEAHRFGLIGEWDDTWGPREQTSEFTETELAEMAAAHGSKAKEGRGVLEGFSEDTPIEAANFAREADINGLDRSELAKLAEHVSFTQDGDVTFTDVARRFLGQSLGIQNNPEGVARGVFQAWTKVARETIGQDAIDTISAAARFNPDARKDVLDVYRKGIVGQLTRADLIRLSEKWSR